MDFIKVLQDNWAVVSNAPWAFGTIIILFGGGGLFLGRFWQNGVITNFESRVALRDDRIAEYERKLGGATPDEAHAKIERLETRIRDLEHDPRKFTDTQIAKMAEALKHHKPGGIIVSFGGGSLECGGVYKQVHRFFTQQGWNVRHWQTMDSLETKTGLLVFANPGDTSPEEIAVREALDAAGIAYDTKARDSTDDVQLVFSDID